MDNGRRGARPQEGRPSQEEAGVEVPFERLDPGTLRELIGEFVSRDWEELGDAAFTLEQKIEEVHRQLRDGRAMVVFDLTSATANIVVRR